RIHLSSRWDHASSRRSDSPRREYMKLPLALARLREQWGSRYRVREKEMTRTGRKSERGPDTGCPAPARGESHPEACERGAARHLRQRRSTHEHVQCALPVETTRSIGW